MKGKWKLQYSDHLPGVGVLPVVNKPLSARTLRLAIAEAKVLWGQIPKRVVRLSRMTPNPQAVTFPHSPKMICELDCVIDPDDRMGKLLE
jgi:hypothetical protein